MYYLIKSILGIFVTKMDKQEILSVIQKIEFGGADEIHRY